MQCSIVLTTYDKPQHLDATLTSIYAQKTSFDFEVIVVNDGPANTTVEVCKKYRSNKGFKYLYTGKTEYGNPARARNVGYRAAIGDVIISQCDDVIHLGNDVIERLVTELQPGEFLLSKTEDWEYVDGKPHKYRMDYCSADKRSVPYFFCGALLREDLYAVGGNDGEFVEPCYDDNWFADCLIKGRGLKPRHSTDILTHHVHHGHPNGSHKKEPLSKALYNKKVAEAKQTGIWQASGGPWKLTRSYIPKCMNFFWADGPMSWLRYLTIKSFRTLNPDWEIKLHRTKTLGAHEKWKTGEVQDYAKYKGVDYSDRLDLLDVGVFWETPHENLAPAHASDLFQWELLSTEGGFYSDMDILYTKPLDYKSFVNQDVVSCHSLGFMTIGFFGASADNPLFKAIRLEAMSSYNGESYQNTGAEAIYRLAGLDPIWGRTRRPGDVAMNKLKKMFSTLDYIELPQETFYPWAWNQIEDLWSSKESLPYNCCGIHWFGGAARSQQMNNLITPGNVAVGNCTLTNYAKYYA